MRAAVDRCAWCNTYLRHLVLLPAMWLGNPTCDWLFVAFSLENHVVAAIRVSLLSSTTLQISDSFFLLAHWQVNQNFLLFVIRVSSQPCSFCHFPILSCDLSFSCMATHTFCIAGNFGAIMKSWNKFPAWSLCSKIVAILCTSAIRTSDLNGPPQTNQWWRAWIQTLD